jgi:hypothetical protein
MKGPIKSCKSAAPTPARPIGVVEKMRTRLAEIHGPGERLNRQQVAGRLAAQRPESRLQVMRKDR